MRAAAEGAKGKGTKGTVTQTNKGTKVNSAKGAKGAKRGIKGGPKDKRSMDLKSSMGKSRSGLRKPGDGSSGAPQAVEERSKGWRVAENTDRCDPPLPGDHR